MNKFIIEIFVEGEFLSDEIVETPCRLLNEQDLDAICVNHDKRVVFVRRDSIMDSGYFLDDDNCWNYGAIENARNAIKRRYE